MIFQDKPVYMSVQDNPLFVKAVYGPTEMNVRLKCRRLDDMKLSEIDSVSVGVLDLYRFLDLYDGGVVCHL